MTPGTATPPPPTAENLTDPPDLGGPAATRASSTARDRPPKKKSKAGGARPGAGRPSAAGKLASETRQIEQALAQLLSVPAIPCAMLGHKWPADHFTTAGPMLAKNLADVAQTNPRLRDLLLKLSQGDSYATILIGTFAYAVPPAIYFLAPQTSALRPTFGVPSIPATGAPQHAPAAPPANGTGAATSVPGSQPREPAA